MMSYEHPVIALDILPTAAVAVGGQLPADRKIDGINLLPYLTDKKKQASHEILFWRKGQDHAVRKGNRKLVKMGSETGLFDLASDIGESRDLKGQRPDVLRKMEEAFERWNSQMIEPVWTRQRRERKTTKKKRRPQSASAAIQPADVKAKPAEGGSDPHCFAVAKQNGGAGPFCPAR